MLKNLLVIFFLLTGSIYAQFSTQGNTTQTGCNCFEVTPDLANQAGSFYNTTDVNLNSNFSLMFNVNFGCTNAGGEGIAFVMQATGWVTGGPNNWSIGYEGIGANTLAVEFDTRDNQTPGEVANWDIGADHLSLQKNGSISHNPANPDMLVSPVNISASSADVEDCLDHIVEIQWTAGANQTLTVLVDGNVRLTYTDNMIANVFGGDNLVKWGWTGCTGVFSNQQLVCTALLPYFTYTPTNCPGQLINFTDASTSYYTLTNWDWNFDGLGTGTGTNPSFTFNDPGNHPVTLTITDNQGCSQDTTIDIGVGFDITTTADDAIICPNTSTTLHVDAAPFAGTDCCFDLVLGDLYDDGWAGNEVEVFVNGTSIGTYFPPINGTGGAYYHTFTICFNHGDLVELVINGDQYPSECTYTLYDESGATILTVPPGPGTWIDGSSQTYTVDCGITPPAYTYVWDNAGYLTPNQFDQNPTATIPSATWFHVDVTDPNTGCIISDSIFIDTYAIADAVISGNATICAGSTADLTITFTGPGPYVVDVTGPSGPLSQINTSTSPYTLTVGEEGNYTITTFTGAGCAGTFSGVGVIDTITPPSVTIGADAQYCDGDPMADLTVTSGGTGTVNWYSDSGLTTLIGTGNTFTPFSTIGATTYYATETEGILGCEGPADQVTITIYPIPVAPSWTGNTLYCDGEMVTPLNGIGTLGGTMTWYDAPPPAFVLSTLNSYSPILNVPGVSVWLTETANGCESPATQIDITVNPTPTAPAVSGTIQYCEGDVPTPLTATPGMAGTITWETASGSLLGSGTVYIPPLTVGSTDYYVYETLNGCTSPATVVTITVDAAPMVSVTERIDICKGDSVEVTAYNNGYTIAWSDGQTGETVWLGPDSTTSFIVTATNPACGFAEDSILIVVHELPEIIGGNDTIIGIGGEVTLWAWANTSGVFEWIPEPWECLNDSCNLVYDVPDQATVYVVIFTDQYGCPNSDSILVDINGYMEIFVPNIFSPNGDGANDYLEVLGPRLFNYHIQVYDRWGKVVFESTEQKEYWDGKLNGEYLAPQTFVYIIHGETVLGESIVKEGNVSIIK